MRRRALALAAVLLALPLGRGPAAAEAVRLEPNQYQLAGEGLRVTYMTESGRAQPRPSLRYEDGSRSLLFVGDDLQAEATELGTLVTATLRLLGAGDVGQITFSLLVPRVNLGPDNSAPVRTIGITTNRRFSMIPGMPLGQTDRYRVTRLAGTARYIAF